jgi:tripartite-type tricarboxylate transporter receptor subunit TctC
LRGIGAARGLPEDVVRRLSAAIGAALRHPEFRAVSARTFQPLRFLDSAEYVAYLQDADAAHRALWRQRPWNS